MKPDLSVVVPLFNEQPNLRDLHRELSDVLTAWGRPYEIILVDDGSTDDTFSILTDIQSQDRSVRVIRLRRNFGQTAAFAAGFAHARGKLIATSDGDLQNDPADLPAMVDKIDEGHDMVCGWRKKRQDPWLTRRLVSNIANWLISKTTGVYLHDYGCSLKVFRSEVIQSLRLYGEMHRFLPAWAASVGASICEVKVGHRPRKWGESKYSVTKTWRVILDLLTVRFLIAYSTKPLYFFGRLGFRFLLCAGASWTWTIAKKIHWGEPLYTDPFFLAGVFLGLAGLQILLIGLLAELNMRTYYESQDKRIYAIREHIHLE